MSVASTSSFSSASSTKGAELEKKAAAASAALVEKMRAATEEKAKKAAEKEAVKTAAAAEKASVKAAKDAEKALKKAEKEAAAETAKAEKDAEKAAKKAAKEAEEAAKPKRTVGRPRKDAASVSSDDMIETIPAITPKMRARIATVSHAAMEIHPALFSTEVSTDPEVLGAENARLRAEIANLIEVCGRQRAAISHTVVTLSSMV
jgi:hypothetical protein